MKTLTVLIGNTDNKLTQQQWNRYVHDVDYWLLHYQDGRYFFGGCATWEPFQNMCWVISIENERLEMLKDQLYELCVHFNQDNIAILVGETEFIKAIE